MRQPRQGLLWQHGLEFCCLESSVGRVNWHGTSFSSRAFSRPRDFVRTLLKFCPSFSSPAFSRPCNSFGIYPSFSTPSFSVRAFSVAPGAPQIRPQKYPFPRTDCQTAIRASILDPPDLRCQTACGSDAPFFHNANRTDRQTDRMFTGKFDNYRPLCSESDAA